MRILRLLPLLLLTAIATRADSVITWDFTFYSASLVNASPEDIETGPNGVLSGSGTIETSSVLNGYGYYTVESISGTMNGDAFSAVPECNTLEGPVCGVGLVYAGAYLTGNYAFGTYSLIDEDEGAWLGETLFGAGLPLNSVGGNGQVLKFTITEDPVTTPETSTLALCLLGIAAVFLFALRVRKA